MAVINREALIKDYKENQSRRVADDIGFTWVIKAHKISLVNALEMAEQVNQWVDLKNGGVREVRAFDYNNKEFVVEGKKWYVLIAQHYTNGEMEDDANIMCPVSLMLFGTMVSGMTYAFEKKEDRDNFFDAINSSKRIKITQTKVRKCDLCGGACDCEYGHNPYPLLCDNARVCGKCNAEQVIPARRAGVFRTKDMSEEEKEEVLRKCLTIVEEQFDGTEKGMWDEMWDKSHPTPNFELPLIKDQPTLQEICGRLNALLDEKGAIRANAITETMKYAGQRLERHIRLRSISSPKDICLTTGSILSQVVYDDLKKHFLKHISIVNEFDAEVKVIRQKIINDLINTDIAPQQEKVKTKAELKKEQTRNANKAKAEEKKLKEEQDRAIAQAQAHAEAQRKKKVREIAIKKQKAIIAEAERHLNKLKTEEA